MSVMTVKFKDQYIGLVKNPVIIVGINPGRQRKGQQDCMAWSGNKSADLLKWVLDGQDNVILTNVYNYQEFSEENLNEGIRDLVNLVNKYNPRMIVALGAYPHLAVVSHIRRVGIPFVKMLHPSYIVRFNHDKDKYKKRFISNVFNV